MNPDLAIVWACILAFGGFAYVAMDGFDLGIGILFPTLRPGVERDIAMNSIAPVWDGNETWLVLGGGGLMAAFPLAYAILLPALYAPITAMVLALIFRGVAPAKLERDAGHRPFWDFAFTVGSIVAALAQGITLGAVLQGVAVDGRSYGGGWWDWLTPFSLLTGASVLVGFGLLGSCWLIWKTEGELQARAYRRSRRLGAGLMACIAAVSLATLFLPGAYYERWFAWPKVLYTAQVPLLVLITSVLFFRSLARKRELAPFLLALALFLLSYIGLMISIYPDVVPNDVTIWEAAAPDRSLGFMLVGAAVLLPIILAYTAHAYWVFRGKVGTEGYH